MEDKENTYQLETENKYKRAQAVSLKKARNRLVIGLVLLGLGLLLWWLGSKWM